MEFKLGQIVKQSTDLGKGVPVKIIRKVPKQEVVEKLGGRVNTDLNFYEVEFAGESKSGLFKGKRDIVPENRLHDSKVTDESFIKTVQKVDAILYHLGYKDGNDYKWSDHDHVLTFKSDDVRKEVAAKIPSKMIHAQYPRTIELEDKGLKDSKDKISYGEYISEIKKMGLENHSETLFKEARRGLVNLENQKKLSGGWWDKINTNEIYSLVKRVDLNLDDAKGKNKYKFIVEFMGKEQTVVVEGYSLEEAKKRVMKQDHVTGIKRVVGNVNDSLFKVKDSFGRKFIISAKTFDSALKKIKDMKLTDSDKLVKLAEEFVMKGSVLAGIVRGSILVSGDGALGRKIDEFYRMFTQLIQQLKSESSKKTVSTSYNDGNQTERFLDKGRELLNGLSYALTHPDEWFESKFGDYTSTGRKFEQMSKILLTSTVNYLNGVKGR